MSALFTKDECNSIQEHIKNSELQLSNLHTRKYHTKKGQRVLRHLNGMFLKNGVISGFVSGPNVSIEYEIDKTGQVTINASNLTVQDALNYLKRYIKTETLQRVHQGHASHRPKLTKGHYYLRRSQSPTVTKAAQKAIAANLISQNFVDQMVKWNLRIIVGGGA